MNKHPIHSKEFFLLILSGIFIIVPSNDALSASVNATVRISVCGNQIAEYGEQCDNSDLAGKSCKKLGYDSGTLSCRIDCSFDKSDCSESDDEENDNNDNQDEINNLSSDERPTSVVARIEKDNETRTLEISSEPQNPEENKANSENGYANISVENKTGAITEITVESTDDAFLIKQGNFSVISRFSVLIDKNSGKIFIISSSGKTELTVFPETIAEKIQSEGTIYDIEKMEIDEEDGELLYVASVKKKEKLFGLLSIKIPLTLKFSAEDGNFIRTETSFIWKLIDSLCF